ncbi:hypothetical protein ANN_10288 [Periplaneta americana]|uniref:Uncharacterized protein n=1 Tax=Periplaneta americana TaxID=6978 RepID=A0ABQ8TP02_PERAM|nr:hypothetical protein ANN_10288 [Periplaneta americana]
MRRFRKTKALLLVGLRTLRQRSLRDSVEITPHLENFENADRSESKIRFQKEETEKQRNWGRQKRRWLIEKTKDHKTEEEKMEEQKEVVEKKKIITKELETKGVEIKEVETEEEETKEGESRNNRRQRSKNKNQKIKSRNQKKRKQGRKIFGAKRDEVTGEWRKLHDAELHALYSSPDIIRNIKSRRLRWAEHIARMGESRNAYRDRWETGGSLKYYREVKQFWEQEEYVRLNSRKERTGMALWRLGIWRLKNRRGNVEKGKCP